MEFTVSQIAALVITICGGFTAICVAAGWVIKIVHNIRRPEITQNERIENIEKMLERHETFLAQDKRRIEVMEEGNRVTQRAILALLAHGIDGNEVEAMERAKSDLQNFLINR